MGRRVARCVRAQAEDVRAIRRGSPLFSARTLIAVLGGLVLLVMFGLNAVGFGSGEAGAGLQQYTAPPSNTVAPVLSGTQHITLAGGSVVPIAVVGNQLTVSDGTWTGNPTFTYLWWRCDSSYANCTQISGANSRSYTLTTADLGSTVVADVAASNGSASRYAYANLRGNVGAPNPSPDAAATGLDWYPGSQPTPTVGETLSPENDPAWWLGATPITFSYQWWRCTSLNASESSIGTNCSKIVGATSLSYTVTAADAGYVLEILMVGSNQYGSNGYKNLFDTAKVVGAAAADTAAPSQPTNLAIAGRSGSSLTLSWDASHDNVGVTGYDVYLDGSKRATVTGTSYSYSGLTCGTSYTLAVAARDAAWNVSTDASTTTTTSACPPPPPPPPPPDALGVNALLHRGGFLQSANGQYRLYLQAGDGNLVLYNSAGHALWATNRTGGDILAVQADGNLVVYSSSRQALWASNTMGSGGSRLVVQNDGNVVLYTSSGRAVWSTNTAGGESPPQPGHAERASVHHVVHTFANYHNASGQGQDIAAGQVVEVSCKVLDGTIRSVNPDGYWYRLASAPWNDRYYAPANTFLNGDPPNGPYSRNTDFAVPDCSSNGSSVQPALSPATRAVSVTAGESTHPSFCKAAACAFVKVTFAGYSAGTHTVACHSSYPPSGEFYSYTTSSPTSSVCVFGYSGYSVWATVDGVSSTHIKWGGPSGETTPPSSLPSLAQYAGRIVQWAGDHNRQPASWVVGADLKRRWIPDTATYACLVRNGYKPWSTRLPSSVLDQLQDLKGESAQCAHVPVCVFPMRWDKLSLTFSYSGDHRYYGNAWQAAKNWTDLGTGITITAAPPGTQGDIVFDDVYIPNNGWYGQTEIQTDWATPVESIPLAPYVPYRIHIKVNQWEVEQSKGALDDFHRTLALTHELGHALGLAHPDVCGVSDASIMKAGGNDVPTRSFNKPQYYDKIALEQLYNIPNR